MEDNQVNSFRLYRDYFNLIKLLPKKKDREELSWAINEYVFENVIPALNEKQMTIFNTLIKQLDKSKDMSNKGAKGGAPLNNSNAKKQAEKQPRKQAEKQAEKQANIVSSFLFLVYSFKFNNNINNLLKEYLELRVKNKYTLTNTVVNRLCNKLNEYSSTDSEKEEIITNAINGAWKDFYPIKSPENGNHYETRLERMKKLGDEIVDECRRNQKSI